MLVQATHDQDLLILKSAVEHTADHVMITNKDGEIRYVNPAFERTTGYSKHEVIGKNPRILQSGLQPKEYYVRLWTTILAGKTFYAHTINKKKNGDLYIADQTISPILDEHGQVVDFVSVWKDITEKTKLEESLRIEKQKLEEIVGFDEKISLIRKSNTLMDFVIAKTMRILEAGKCSIMFVDTADDTMCLQATKGFEEDVEPPRIKVRYSIAEKVVRTGKALLVKDVTTDPLFFGTKKAYYAGRSFMVAPIRRDREVIGVINVFDKHANLNPQEVFNETDLKILCMIAKEVSVAFENVKFYKELQYLTITDPLTNIHNYRHFAKSLDYEIRRLKRTSQDLGLMMIDIDNFKSYNDQLGHLEGDQLLKDLSQLIQADLRDVDILCRYAGDEFVIILPGVDAKGCEIIAERIRKSVAEFPFKKPVMVSIGGAIIKKDMTRHELISKADQALYKAKQQGKNSVCIFG